MAIVYSGPGVPGGEVSPGSGSTGFTSRGVAFANTSGQLTASTGLTWDSTVRGLGVGTTGPRASIEATSHVLIGTNNRFLQGIDSSLGIRNLLGMQSDNRTAMVSGSGGFTVLNSAQSADLLSASALGHIVIGSSATTGMLSLPSTLNVTSAVGTSGGAAAPPANPATYIKILAPASAGGSITTLYLAAYLSTG